MTDNPLNFLPEGITYTFRTTFDLSGTLPETAVVRGKLLADDRVVAIRINGKEAPLPQNACEQPPFHNFLPFSIAEGFVEGNNVIEIDVWNGPSPGTAPYGTTPMALCAELKGSVLSSPTAIDDRTPAVSQSPNHGKEKKSTTTP